MANAASSGLATITTLNMLGTAVCLDGTTNCVALFSSIRLRKIEMWGPPSSSLAPVSVMVKYPAGANSSISNPEVTHSDTSIGATVPAHVVSKPPKMSLADSWLSSDTANSVFQLSFPINCVVDITYLGQMSFAIPGPSITPPNFTTTGGTIGLLYVLALDATPSTGLLIPVECQTLT